MTLNGRNRSGLLEEIKNLKKNFLTTAGDPNPRNNILTFRYNVLTVKMERVSILMLHHI
jgi:hypothetical protein